MRASGENVGDEIPGIATIVRSRRPSESAAHSRVQRTNAIPPAGPELRGLLLPGTGVR